MRRRVAIITPDTFLMGVFFLGNAKKEKFKPDY
jgi:hypothetical protein